MKAVQNLLLLTGSLIVSLSHGAEFIDDFSNDDNITAEGNIAFSISDGTLTLIRTEPEGDALVDWQIGGTQRFSLDPTDGQSVLRITPSAAIGNGEWSVFILFFNKEGAYVGAKELMAFTNGTDTSVEDISAFATEGGVADADSYFGRIWIQGSSDPSLDFSQTGFEFDQFAVISDPFQ